MDAIKNEPKVVSLLANKGGVGKSTIAHNLMRFFSSNGLSVSGIDFDQQLNLKQVCPEHTLESFDGELSSVDSDVLVIDTAPTFNENHFLLMAQSDLIIVPVRIEIFDLLALKKLVNTAKVANVSNKLKLVLLHTGKNKRLYKEFREKVYDIASASGVEVLAELRLADAVTQANINQIGVVDYEGASKATKGEFNYLFDEVSKCLQ